nr:hypothetical protein [uncultured Dyadobacter sp.]
MGQRKNNFNERSSSSYKRSHGVREVKEPRETLIVLSFRNFDRNQGQNFEEWQHEELLALAISKLREICNLTRIEATKQQIIKEYEKGLFPPNSDFYHPKHIANDIAWCSMHIQGKECVIGFFEENIFHIVFLDKDHRFWITEKKNT